MCIRVLVSTIVGMLLASAFVSVVLALELLFELIIQVCTRFLEVMILGCWVRMVFVVDFE